MIPVQTPKGLFHVWTKRVGDNPATKLLLLHGGPGGNHEPFEVFDDYLPGAGVEYYYYDQLGSGFSDKPDDPELWEIDRFVEEVEQVRHGLGLDVENFFLLGASWGGMLAIEYALRYQNHLKGLIISNMMASIPAHCRYQDEVLIPRMDQLALREIRRLEQTGQTDAPAYKDLLMEHYYRYHILRMPPGQWPEPVLRGMAHTNRAIYELMQSTSEMSVTGRLANWDRTEDLHRIEVPTLVIGAEHDTMDPAHLRWMAQTLPRGTYWHCPQGSHFAMYDDQATYMRGVITFLAGSSTAEASP